MSAPRDTAPRPSSRVDHRSESISGERRALSLVHLEGRSSPHLSRGSGASSDLGAAVEASSSQIGYASAALVSIPRSTDGFEHRARCLGPGDPRIDGGGSSAGERSGACGTCGQIGAGKPGLESPVQSKFRGAREDPCSEPVADIRSDSGLDCRGSCILLAPPAIPVENFQARLSESSLVVMENLVGGEDSCC